jgi:hypothetical protein
MNPIKKPRDTKRIARVHYKLLKLITVLNLKIQVNGINKTKKDKKRLQNSAVVNTCYTAEYNAWNLQS